MGYGESGGGDIEIQLERESERWNGESGGWNIKNLADGESGGCEMENLEDGIQRIWRMGYGEAEELDMESPKDGYGEPGGRDVANVGDELWRWNIYRVWRMEYVEGEVVAGVEAE